MSAGIKKIKRLMNAGREELAEKLLARKLVKTSFNLNGNMGTPLDKSIADASRVRTWDETGESCTEYGFVKDTFPEEEGAELDRTLLQCFGYEILSPFDCTGRWATVSIHGHRNPNGMISVIHNICIDI